MPDRITQLLEEARRREQCLDLARNLERRREDFKDATATGNVGLGVGFGLVVLGGLAMAFIAPPLGIGMLAAGLGAGTVAMDAKATAMKKAQKELERAIADLEECLRS